MGQRSRSKFGGIGEGFYFKRKRCDNSAVEHLAGFEGKNFADVIGMCNGISDIAGGGAGRKVVPLRQRLVNIRVFTRSAAGFDRDGFD